MAINISEGRGRGAAFHSKGMGGAFRKRWKILEFENVVIDAPLDRRRAVFTALQNPLRFKQLAQSKHARDSERERLKACGLHDPLRPSDFFRQSLVCWVAKGCDPVALQGKGGLASPQLTDV